MNRRACILVVIAICWLACPASAQRVGGAPARGSVSISGGNIHVGRGSGHSGGVRHGRHHRQGSLFYPVWYSDWYNDGFEYEEPESAVATPAPQVIVVPSEAPAALPKESAVASPLVIEVPATAEHSAMKKQMPTIFVLSGGRRLETTEYLLTAESLFVTVNRQHRRIPLSTVDIDATLATNRDRGVEVQFPDDRSHIVLAF